MVRRGALGLCGEHSGHLVIFISFGKTRMAVHTRPLEGLVIAHAAVNGGMISNFSRALVRRLGEEGAMLHFYCSRYPVFGWSPPIEELEALGGTVHLLPIPEGFAPFREVWCVLTMALDLRRNGVQVLHTRGSVMGFVGRVAAKISGVPIVLHHQDDLVLREGRLTGFQRRLVAFVERALSGLCDRSLFVSRTVMDAAIQAGFKQDRCALVGNDLSEIFQEAAKSASPGDREKSRRCMVDVGVPEDAKVIGCVGRLAHLKGIDLLLEAAGELLPEFPEWVVVIKGNGPLRESFLREIGSRGLSGRVFLLTEEWPAKDLPSLYACFDLFCLPTRREGFGMVFAEAMAMGVCVVHPRLEPVTEVVPVGCGEPFAPDDPSDLVRSLRSLMSDPARRSALAARGRSHALATWCGRWSAAQRCLQVYQDQIEEKGIESNLRGPRR